MVYLTIVSIIPEKTPMPDLRDLSLRQAQSMLESAGLKPGKLIFIKSFDEDAVQNQLELVIHIVLINVNETMNGARQSLNLREYKKFQQEDNTRSSRDIWFRSTGTYVRYAKVAYGKAKKCLLN